jgi:NADH:ubiquinone reductase (H+-translocating)
MSVVVRRRLLHAAFFCRGGAGMDVDRNHATAQREHVVVVGGGFGGLAVARELSRRRHREAPVDVTLIDRRNHHTFQPLLYQVATAGLQPQDIGISLRAILRHRGVNIRLGDVVGVDPAARKLALADGEHLSYDRLVLAAGAVTQDLGIEGVAEHAFELKWLAHATRLRNHILRCFEAASADASRRRDGTLTFVVAGGGPTGVELVGSIAELVHVLIRNDHPEIDPSDVHIVLVELMEQLLPSFTERSGKEALEALRDRDIDVRLGVGIAKATDDRVELTDEQVITARTLVWAAGVSASPLVDELGVELGPGRRLPVDDRLRLQGHPDIHAIGDIAAAPDRQGDPLPQLAAVAMQQGKYLGKAIVTESEGREPRAFRYRNKGVMATIGRADAVAELPGRIHLKGPVAWLAWLALHLLMLVGFKNRVGVLGSWLWNYLTYDHAERLILDQYEPERTEETWGPVKREALG